MINDDSFVFSAFLQILKGKYTLVYDYFIWDDQKSCLEDFKGFFITKSLKSNKTLVVTHHFYYFYQQSIRKTSTFITSICGNASWGQKYFWSRFTSTTRYVIVIVIAAVVLYPKYKIDAIWVHIHDKHIRRRVHTRVLKHRIREQMPFPFLVFSFHQ